MSIAKRNTETVLRTFAERVIKAAKLNLGATRTITYNDGKKKRRRQVSSGKLKDSIDYNLTTGVHLLMSFTMEDYGKFIDEGVSGTKYKVPGGSRFGFGASASKGEPTRLESIKKWMKTKNIKARDLKTKSFVKQTDANIDKAAFLISRSIKQKGIPKSEFFQAPFRMEFAKLPEEVLKAVSMDVDEFLKFTKR